MVRGERSLKIWNDAGPCMASDCGWLYAYLCMVFASFRCPDLSQQQCRWLRGHDKEDADLGWVIQARGYCEEPGCRS